ncbi:hypothetical protein Syun_027138 [Stephania yunnanensis]|uniref:Protein kinase domain-containing protein n=1 Tax=Stephania yunnanensis TaxID=152371 RepID=A0AAP0EIF6_9MAGN
MKHSKGSSFTKKKLVLTLCVVIVGGLLIFISAFHYFFKKSKGKGLLQRNRLQRQLFSPSLETNEETNAKFELPNFDLNSMMVATENFSNASKLGTGGFGSVYKIKLEARRWIGKCVMILFLGLLEEFFIFIKTRDLESFTGTSK